MPARAVAAYPFLADLADLGQVCPAAGWNRDGVQYQYLAHPVIAYPLAAEHVGDPVASFPSDGESVRPAMVDKDPPGGRCAEGVTTTATHRCGFSLR